jgi:hypothetical protein
MAKSVEQSSFAEYRRSHPDVPEAIVIRRLCERLLAEAEAEPPVPVERVASLRGIAHVGARDQPWAGVLEPRETSFVIWVRLGDGYERQRFTVCHETGHTFFTGFAETPQYRCNGRRSMLEERCDFVAAELLLPHRFFAADLNQADFDLEAVERLAHDYEASIESTALRFIDLWTEPAALLVLHEAHKPTERGREATCEPKLRLSYAHAQGEWPYFRRFKSVESDTAFGRALDGELVSEVGDLGELVDGAGPVEICARRYGSNARVLALVRPVSPRRMMKHS